MTNEDSLADPRQQTNDDVPTGSNQLEENEQLETDPIQPSLPTQPSLSSIKPGIKVTYQDFPGSDQPVHQATIKSRAGKAKGKYADFWNTKRNDGTDHTVDFSKVHN